MFLSLKGGGGWAKRRLPYEEWTESAFYPFSGYIVDWPYREYSALWFGTRKVLKGGAWTTRSRLACNTYRNFFEPFRRDVFAGFRTCAI